MFHRIQLEDWHHAASLVSFLLFFTSFLIALCRTAFMTRGDVRRMENLPLESERAPVSPLSPEHE